MQENISLAPYTTFRVGGSAKYFVVAETETDVVETVRWAEANRVPLFVLGGGSNLLVADEGFSGLVLQIAIVGMLQDGCRFDVGAGENWDRFVDRTTEAQCAGVECLAGIPGSVGGTPVQNVGAYGQEVSETIVSVRAFDRRNHAFVEIPNAECRFRYRESLFNTDAPGRFIVTRVRFELRPDGAPTLRYADLQRRFAGAPTPSLSEVASAVRSVRRDKGMVLIEGEPDCRSAGSFFKNPVLDKQQVLTIASSAGVDPKEVPCWPVDGDRVKVPAAWLLEKAGFVKGFGAGVGDGGARISSRHTLALTNWSGEAKCMDVRALADDITAGVEQRFGIRLQREPVFLNPSSLALQHGP